MTVAARPASSAVQSKNIWKESEMSPKLLVQTPYSSSTTAKLKFSTRNENKLREFLSEKMRRKSPPNFSFSLNLTDDDDSNWSCRWSGSMVAGEVLCLM